jgi:ADYC domain
LIRYTANALAVNVALIVAGLPFASAPQTPVRSVEVEGAAFVITLPDGRVLGQNELPGVQLVLGDGSGQQRHIRIDSVERDAKDPAGEVMLYAFSERDPTTGEWRNICEPDPEGRRLGFPLSGAFAPDGQHVASAERFLITCTGGAEGKCVRFGYKPWRQSPDGALAAYYQTCVRLVRADYCGDGTGHTVNGTLIDLFDKIGIQRDEPAPGMTFEAAWGPDGAVCVRHTRLRGAPDLITLAQQCPHLAGRVGEECDETTPALLFNRSFEP